MKIKILTYIYNILLSIISSIQLIISPENEYREIEEEAKIEYSIKSINKIDVEEIAKNVIKQHYKEINIDDYIFKDLRVDRCYISHIGDTKDIERMTKMVYMSVLEIKPTYYLGKYNYKIGDKVKFKTVTNKTVTGLIKEIGIYDYVNKEIIGHFKNENEIEYALKNSNNALMSATIEIQDSNYNKAVKGRELTTRYENILRHVK